MTDISDLENEDEIIIADDSEIEIVDDDTPEEELSAAVGENDDDGELESYSERVQKRIKKEVGKAKNFKREADDAKRRESAAIEYARNLAEEVRQLKERTLSTQDSAIALTKASVDSNLEALQKQLEKAVEEGDAKAQADLTIKINKAVIDQASVTNAEKQVKHERETFKAEKDKPLPQVRRETPANVSDLASDWFTKNKWFKVDESGTPQNEASAAAHAYSGYLLARGHSMDEPEFYEMVDKKMSEDFPDLVKPATKKKETEGGTKRPPTGSSQRQSNSGAPQKKSGKIMLEKSEVSVALRMKPSWWGGGDDPSTPENKKWLLRYAKEKEVYARQQGDQ